ncbi:MAG TPA: PilC/PilY family type IV pilus protein [Myxococcaceae bacterium]|nr:PilC/PilY family type IV pilus protein [Myxococcaceae bacterium]
MRHLKPIFSFSVMWVLVFVMAAGPLPLGLPQAHAGPVITDVPGIKSFYEPKIFIIFDTSKSMQYRPGDLNGDPSAIGQDWDPGNPTAPCENKFCLGKKALYSTLPKFTSRIYMGLSGYNQYYQLTKQPENLQTFCKYDRIASAPGPWNTWLFNSLTDLTGTGTDPTFLGATSPVVSISTLANAPGAHNVRKEGVSNLNANPQYVNVVGAGASPTDTLTVAGIAYPWWKRIPIDGQFSFLQVAGSCPAQFLGYNAGACAVQPCDLTLTGTMPQAYPPIWSADVGPTFTQGPATYTRPITATSGTFNDVCGLTSPYNGGQFACNGVQNGGCTLVQNSGPNKTYVASTSLYENGVSPGPNWDPLPSTSSNVSVQLTTYGQSCPSVGTTFDWTSSDPNWSWMATQGTGPGQPSDTGCRNVLGQRCSWMMVADTVIPGETYTHYCTFQRTIYNWHQYTFTCNYTASKYLYTTGYFDTYCNYRYYQDVFATPQFLYSIQPNPGDIVGATSVTYSDRNDLTGQPTPVSYSGGAFSNGDCPNLIANSATYGACNNGVICKLSWVSGTVPGYPKGRYSLLPSTVTGYPWLNVNSPGLYPAADPAANLTDPLFPANPMAYSGDWLSGGGFPDQYFVDLVADYYDPTSSNPPVNPPLAHDPVSCPSCQYQFSFTPPPTVDAAGFAAVATALPPKRLSGWAQNPDGTSAVSWTPLALDNALPGQPILSMLSKYDPVANPMGLQTPEYGDLTPLTGAMKNIYDYLASTIDSDPYAACRSYYVLLLTDGEEFPVLPVTDPVGAVKNLRNLTTNAGLKVDVKTFVIGFGFAAPSPELNQMAQAGGTSVSASDPSKLDLSSNGQAYDGSDPARLLASLDATFGTILDGYFTRSKPVINVSGTEMYIGYFRLLFNGTEWQGKMDSINIDGVDLPTYTASVDDTNYTYLWRYGQAIDLQATRQLYSSLDPNSGNRIDFALSSGGWSNGNTPAQQSTLDSLISATPGVGETTIAFLANQGVIGNQPPDYGAPALFTNGVPKTSRASDIYHAIPAIVEGATNGPNWPDATEIVAYSNFGTAVAARKKTVYIGANDGMMHAVEDAVTADVPAPEAGQERWAYVPKQILGSLASMMDGHAFGVDGSVAISDVCGPEFGGGACTVAAGWRTLMVGAFGKGAGGLYALDITDPLNPLVKWEINNPLDEILSRPYAVRLGYTTGAPVIARTKPGGTPKWSVFMPGGIAPNADSLGVPWGNVFYVLDASTGLLLNDPNPARFVIPDDPADPTVNGLPARPTLYRPGDSAYVQRVFFTDLEGKVWKVDVSSTNIIDWTNQITPTSDPFFDPAASNPVCSLDLSGSPLKILDATTGVQVATGTTTLPLPKPRPTIYNRPYLALDNSTGLLNVYVGTGDSEHPNTPSPSGYDYFYGVTDVLSGCARPLFAVRFSQNEKMLSDPAFDQNVVYVTTYLPPAGAAGTCSDLGHGFLYSFDAHTGLPVKAIVDALGVSQSKIDLGVIPGGTGIPSSPMVRNGKLYVATETDPAHPRQFNVGNNPPTQIKVEGWQRVK